MITHSDLDFLTSPTGAQLLDQLAQENLSEDRILSLLTRLRRQFTAEEARAAVEMSQLRQKAVDKFGDDARSLFFTREALEQASDPLVRRYRSAFAAGQQVIDACCGIGADSLAMVQAGGEVLGLDIDPVRIKIAAYNAATLSLNARFQITDVRDELPETDIIFFDPARRDANGKRLFDVERYQPPLSVIRQWHAPHIVVKLSPGVELPQLTDYEGSVEFISVNGDLKEATLWLGFGFRARKATLLTQEQVYHWEAEDNPASALLSEPRAWLLEPDASLLRAVLVADAALHFGAYQLDETIAYLTADEHTESPWLRGWKIIDWMPFHLKKLRAYLRQRNVGHVTVKKRGSAITPEELIAGLKLKGDESRTVVLTRCHGQPIVLICQDILG